MFAQNCYLNCKLTIRTSRYLNKRLPCTGALSEDTDYIGLAKFNQVFLYILQKALRLLANPSPNIVYNCSAVCVLCSTCLTCCALPLSVSPTCS